jgi:hypothetical protein
VRSDGAERATVNKHIKTMAFDNEAAKQAFADWWATMEAKGYQYGYEALCNVWVGFEDGREALARELITTAACVDRLSVCNTEIDYGYVEGREAVVIALRAKCAQLGIDLHHRESEGKLPK